METITWVRPGFLPTVFLIPDLYRNITLIMKRHAAFPVQLPETETGVLSDEVTGFRFTQIILKMILVKK